MELPPLKAITQEPLVAVGRNELPSPRLVARALVELVNGTDGQPNDLRCTALQAFGGILAAWGTPAKRGTISVDLSHANLSQYGVAATEHAAKPAATAPEKANSPHGPASSAGRIVWPTPFAL